MFRYLIFLGSLSFIFLLISCGDSGGKCPSTPCGKNFKCVEGRCVSTCLPGLQNCSGECVDLFSNFKHCGACDHHCAEGQDCVDGFCQKRCEQGLTFCSGNCVNLQNDDQHCGQCDKACPAGYTCQKGSCKAGCTSKNTCDGQCVDLQSNPRHCGRCHNVCPQGICFQGKCSKAWAVRLGGKAIDIVRGVETNSSGISYATGIFIEDLHCKNRTVHSNGNSVDFFLAKITASGGCLWLKGFGTSDVDQAASVAIDKEGNPYIIGFFSGTLHFSSVKLVAAGHYDVFIAKFRQSNGNIIWAKNIEGGGYDYGQDIVFDGVSGFYILGDFDENLILSSKIQYIPSQNQKSIFIAKMDDKGDFQWLAHGSARKEIHSQKIAVNSKQESFITGFFKGEAHFEKLILQSQDKMSFFVAKLDAKGHFVWGKSYPSSSENLGHGIALSKEGDPIVVGEFAGTLQVGSRTLRSAGKKDIFIIAFSAKDGSVLWAKSFGGTGEDIARDITSLKDGSLYVTGEFSSQFQLAQYQLSSSGDTDSFILKLNSRGDVLTATNQGGNDTDVGYSITSSPYGLILGGSFSSMATFHSQLLRSLGSFDGFITLLPK